MLTKHVVILSSLLLSSSALANWQLENKASNVNYVSTKASAVSEVNSFTQLQGSISDDGKLSISIDLSSVETNVDIRNDRMKSLFFEVSSFATAEVTAMVDAKTVKAMKVGDTYQDTVNFTLSLHGKSSKTNTQVQVVKLANNKLLATSVSPIIINAGEYDLVNGVDKLREVAKLPSISTAVPVSFNLVFNQK